MTIPNGPEPPVHLVYDIALGHHSRVECIRCVQQLTLLRLWWGESGHNQSAQTGHGCCPKGCKACGSEFPGTFQLRHSLGCCFGPGGCGECREKAFGKLPQGWRLGLGQEDTLHAKAAQLVQLVHADAGCTQLLEVTM